MFALLWVAFAGLSAAQYGCTEATNGTKTSCLAPSYVECLDQCTLQSYEEQCLSFPGCRWNASENYYQRCSSPLTNTCRSLSNATECTNVTGCLWHTTLCKDTRNCDFANNTPPPGGAMCLTAQTESACAALGSACYMRESCINTNRCDINEDQNSCTATAGCFWSEIVLTYPNSNVSLNERRCQECFGLPTHNRYLAIRGYLNQVCNYTSMQAFTRVISAVPSATGCDGGVPLPYEPLDCVPFTTSSASWLSAFSAVLFAASLLLILE